MVKIMNKKEKSIMRMLDKVEDLIYKAYAKLNQAKLELYILDEKRQNNVKQV
jgi:hypothetical protein